jgi:hypothetical protein
MAWISSQVTAVELRMGGSEGAADDAAKAPLTSTTSSPSFRN